MTPKLKLTIVTVAWCLGGPATAEVPLAALSQIMPGQWSLTSAGAPSRSICLNDPRVLLQLRHTGVACSRYVITNEKAVTTVHYTCPGAGHGRTEVKVETPRLIQVQSQGIADNAPFDWVFEGRMTGTCTSPAKR